MIEAPEDLNVKIFQDYCDMLPPAALGEIYREFLVQTRARLQALSGGTLTHAMAHTIAGTAGMLGAVRIAARASRIENGEAAAGPGEIAGMLADCAALESLLRERQVSL